MTVKEWLNRGRNTQNVINSINETLSLNDNELLRNALIRKQKKLFQLQNEIFTVIDEIEEDKYFLILYDRYILLKNWDEISFDNHYSLRHVYRLHGEALKKVSKLTVCKKVLKDKQKAK